MDSNWQNQNNNQLDPPSFSQLSSSIAAGAKRRYPEYQVGPRKTFVRSPMEPEIGPQGVEEVVEEQASSTDNAVEQPEASQVEANAPNDRKKEEYKASSPNNIADEGLQTGESTGAPPSDTQHPGLEECKAALLANLDLPEDNRTDYSTSMSIPTGLPLDTHREPSQSRSVSGGVPVAEADIEQTVYVSPAGVPFTRTQLRRYQIGVRQENGDWAYFQPNFIEELPFTWPQDAVHHGE